jgi:hypothetical protein
VTAFVPKRVGIDQLCKAVSENCYRTVIKTIPHHRVTEKLQLWKPGPVPAHTTTFAFLCVSVVKDFELDSVVGVAGNQIASGYVGFFQQTWFPPFA